MLKYTNIKNETLKIYPEVLKDSGVYHWNMIETADGSPVGEYCSVFGDYYSYYYSLKTKKCYDSLDYLIKDEYNAIRTEYVEFANSIKSRETSRL